MLYVLTRKSVFIYDGNDEDGHVETKVDVVGVYDDFTKVREAFLNCIKRTKMIIKEADILYEELNGLSYAFIQGTVDQEYEVTRVEQMNILSPVL